MTWASRLKLTIGLLVVLAIVAVCFVIFTQRNAQVISTSAEISAEQYQVGSDYAGTVTEQYVNVGDTVKKGQKLFTVTSLSVLQDVSSKLLAYSSQSYTVSKTGAMTFRATVPGRISKIDTKAGGFVQAGAELATIDRSDSLYVMGTYDLTPRDYERIRSGAVVDVTLPNQTVLPGTVDQVTVQTADGSAQTQVRIASKDLRQGSQSGLVNAGTPVTATLHLREDGILAGPQDALLAFVQKIGL